MDIKSIIEQSDTVAGKSFDLFIQFCILVSLVSFTCETLPGLSDRHKTILSVIEIVTILIFSIEYILRIIVADKRLKFVFSFFGLIDLLAILPFYIASGIDLRSIRVVRMFRLFRIFKVVKYNSALQRLGKAFYKIKEELILFLIATGLLIYISSVGIYYFEQPVQPDRFKSIFHCLWWAVVTLSTVGYGDMYPITAGGKVFASVLILLGMGIIAVPTGLIASALTELSRGNK